MTTQRHKFNYSLVYNEKSTCTNVSIDHSDFRHRLRDRRRLLDEEEGAAFGAADAAGGGGALDSKISFSKTGVVLAVSSLLSREK